MQFVWEESRMIGGFSRLMRLFAFPCSIYFKSMCLITIPLLDAVTFDALSWSDGRRRNIWTSSFVSSSRSSLTIVSRFGLSVAGLCSSGHFHAITSDCLSLNIFIRDQKRFSQGLLQLLIHLCMGRYWLSLYLPLDGSPRFTSHHFWWCLNVLKIHIESKSYFTLQSVILHQ